jgi:hypothetical protein
MSLWSGFQYMTIYYDKICPTAASVDSGHIYPLNSHSHIVYLTTSEALGVYVLVLAAAGCFISGYLIDRKMRQNIEARDGIEN